MNFNYPYTVPCSFIGFPSSLLVTLGSSISSYLAGYSLGSRITLTETPNSGEEMGWMPDPDADDSWYDAWIRYDETTSSDVYLKTYLGVSDIRKIYSDTGSDDSFGIKVEYLGFGSFYMERPSDVYYSFELYKGLRLTFPVSITVEGGFEITKKTLDFGSTTNCTTLIPVSTTINEMFSVPAASYTYCTTASSSSSDDEGIWIDGVYYSLSNGKTVTLSTGSVVRWVNGGVVIG